MRTNACLQRKRCHHGVALAITSCSQLNLTERQALLNQRNSDSGKYYVLAEASPEVNEYFLRKERAFVLGSFDSIERSLGEAGKSNATLSTLRTRFRDIAENEEDTLKSIRKRWDSTMDHLFYYRYQRGSNIEDGWLISSGGVIKDRFPMGSVTLGLDPHK
jgi:hypothetical protein